LTKNSVIKNELRIRSRNDNERKLDRLTDDMKSKNKNCPQNLSFAKFSCLDEVAESHAESN
jgi:hypothetical protein